LKVVFFDWWEKGFHHFVPLRKRLLERGDECLMVHYGRWYAPDVTI
jgi:hypothetical protein